MAIQTEDLGVATDEGLVLIGRDREAAPRGCSLDAEGLKTRQVRNCEARSGAGLRDLERRSITGRSSSGCRTVKQAPGLD